MRPRPEANGGKQVLRLAGRAQLGHRPIAAAETISAEATSARRKRDRHGWMNWGLAANLIGLPLAGFGRNRGKTMDARAPLQLDFDANEVRSLIAKYLGIDAERVTDDVHFSNDFDLDSLGRLELLIVIEEEFVGVEFSDTAHRIEAVGDLIRHIEITNKASAA